MQPGRRGWIEKKNHGPKSAQGLGSEKRHTCRILPQTRHACAPPHSRRARGNALWQYPQGIARGPRGRQRVCPGTPATAQSYHFEKNRRTAEMFVLRYVQMPRQPDAIARLFHRGDDSMMGTAAAQCLELGETRARDTRDPAPREHGKLEAPRESDGMRPYQCRRCGLVGVHENRDDCISALRDALAYAQFQAGRAARKRILG